LADVPIAIQTDIGISQQGALAELESAENPDVIIRCGAETCVMVMFGRMKMGEAIAKGLMTVDGPEALASQFAGAFVGG